MDILRKGGLLRNYISLIAGKLHAECAPPDLSFSDGIAIHLDHCSRPFVKGMAPTHVAKFSLPLMPYVTNAYQKMSPERLNGSKRYHRSFNDSMSYLLLGKHSISRLRQVIQ